MRNFIRLIVPVLVFVLAFPFFTEASTLKSVRITETTPVFNELQKVAVFQKGTFHTITHESDRFYHTVLGNEPVKFSKQRAAFVNSAPRNLKGLHPVRVKTSTYVPITDRPSASGKVLGHLQPNISMFVQRLKGQYYPIIVGGTTGYIHKNQVEIESGIPVLMYHDIVLSKTDNNSSTLEIEKFTEQMAYLKQNGWTTITPKQLEDWIARKITLPKKSVLITFDDGYQSTIDLAYPILKRHGFQATSFIITSRIGRTGMVSEQDLKRTADVYSYQNHTHLFHMFNSKTNLSLFQYETQLAIYSDVQQANNSIEQILGEGYHVSVHAYPYGKRSPQAIRALKMAGITSAYTIDEGNVFQGDPLFELRRQRVHSNMTLQQFAEKLKGR